MYRKFKERVHKFITILLVVSLLPWGSLAYSDTGFILGDVNGNGLVDIEDSRLITRYLTGEIDELLHPENADVTQDGKITLEDSMAVAQKTTGSSQVIIATPEYGLTGKTYAGSTVRIEIFEKFAPYNITGGTVRIKSISTGYDSGDQPLTFERDGRSLYYRWETSGLLPASDYEVYINTMNSETSQPIQTLLSNIVQIVPYQPGITVSLTPRSFEIPYLAQAQDAYAPAPGIPLDFHRTFPQDSANSPYLGPMGRGWSHSFDLFLEEFTDGRIAFFGPDGFNRWFSSNGDGTYMSSKGDYGKLTRNMDGTFQLREKTGFIYHFSSNLRVDYMQDLNLNKVTYIYNVNNLLVEVKHSNGLSFNFLYNSQGRISKFIDHVGRETSYEYSPDGTHLLRVTALLGRVTTYTYSLGQGEASDHRLTSIVFPDNTHSYFTFDSQGRISSQSKDGGAEKILYSYDVDGTTRITDAAEGVTVIRVNEKGQPIKVIDPNGAATLFEYDSNLNVFKVTDSLERNYIFEYDERGNVIQMNDPLNQVKVGYEPNFNKISWLEDSLGRITTFSYDHQGNLLNITYPDGSLERYVYDKDYRLQSKISRNGKAINYEFDDMGLVLSKTYNDEGSINYTYDSIGRILNATDSSGSTIFEYDEMDRLIRIIYPGNRNFQYEYDSAGKRTRAMYPDGNILNYDYDAIGRLVKIKNGTDEMVVEYHYDAASRRTRKILSNGAYTTFGYDASGQILSIANYGPLGNIISRFNYTYDAAGNRLSKETIEGVENYTYDALNQLIGVTYPDGNNTQYIYDSMGNRQSVIENSMEINYVVNNLNQYTAVGSTLFEYDANGNMISKTDGQQKTYYDYDFEDRLIRVRMPNETISYTYNSFGLRNSRTDSNGTVYYLWDGDQVGIEESDTHKTIAKYIWGDILDEVILMERDGSSYYYAQDAMLSVSDIIDSSGDTVDHYRYRVFGEPSKASSFDNPWFFTGAAYDFKTGVQYNRFRYYSPAVGRFLTIDPINIQDDVNLYSYVSNNPETQADAYGLRKTFGGYLESFWWGAVFSGTVGFGYATIAGIPIGLTPAYAPYVIGTTVAWGFWGGIAGIVQYNVLGGGSCPTFIQLPMQITPNYSGTTNLDLKQEHLFAKITVPIEGALLRSDIPIFGVAGGTDFKEYKVEYGPGRNPTKWNLIESSTTPQNTTDVGIEDIPYMQGDIDIRGNLATWNTGLKNWDYLPWHPPEDPTDLNGVYTLRLTVLGKDGKKAEDKMVVEVGRVIAQTIPGIALSPDQKVVMRFPEHALTEPFRIYTILPVSDTGVAKPPAPEGIQIIGKIYRIQEPGDRFIKDVILEFNVSTEEINGRDTSNIGIMRYDVTTKKWIWLDTVKYINGNTFFNTILSGLPAPEAIYAIGYDPLNVHSQKRDETNPVEALSAISDSILVNNTFEENTSNWKSRDRFVGADLDLVRAAPDGSNALMITGRSYAGSFAVTVLDRSFDAREYPVMSFDYRIAPGVKTDYYLLVNGRWYDLGFTDDHTDFRNRGVNIANLGNIDGIRSDDQWHSASVNLYELLREKTRNTKVDAIIMADWDVTGYMKLEFGDNTRGAAYYIDNFRITAGTLYDLSNMIVDDFETSGSTNLLGGLDGNFSDPWMDSCKGIRGEKPGLNSSSALKLTFDGLRPGGYCGYWTSLMNVSLEDMKEVSLKLYSTEEVLPMSLGLRQRPWVETKVPLQPYLSSPDVDGWRTATVPLSVFQSIANFSSMDALFITLEKELSGNKPIFIDDIEFHVHPTYNKVVDFGMHGMEHNLLGGEFHTYQEEAAIISSDYHIDTTTLQEIGTNRISFGGNIGLDYGGGRFSYAIWETNIPGYDVRGFKDIVLKVRGEKGGEKPNIWLDDGTNRHVVRAKEFAPITSAWQEIHIPLEKFASQGTDLSHLVAAQLVFEWEEMSGTLYVAKIYFDR